MSLVTYIIFDLRKGKIVHFRIAFEDEILNVKTVKTVKHYQPWLAFSSQASLNSLISFFTHDIVSTILGISPLVSL